MFESKTLFIVGAGASNEVDLPIGNELIAKIVDLVDIRPNRRTGETSGDPDIYEAIRQHIKNPDGTFSDISPYLNACWHIRDAMSQESSIDNFIDNHRDQDTIKFCGKLSIAQSILIAERNSRLFISGRNAEDNLDYGQLQETWYHRFMQILFTGLRKGDIRNIFENISFIIFNYDRCIEQYIFHSLQNYYRISSDEAAEILKTLKIFHPYGTVGYLPWQSDENLKEFGGTGYASDLLSISKGIKGTSKNAFPRF